MRTRLGAALAGLVVVLATSSCGSQPRPVAGAVELAGSAMLQPLTSKIGQQFLEDGNTTKIEVAPYSTDVAIKRFCSGKLDIVDVSRSLTDAEKSACRGRSVTYRRIHIANDAIVVIANPHLGLSCVVRSKLKTWWSAPSDGTVTRWRDLGAGYPDTTMDLYGPGPGSGTFEVFERLAEESDAGIRHDFTVTPDENVATAGVAKYHTAAGFVSFPAYTHRRRDVSAVAIDDGSGCVIPTPRTVQKGSYALSRPLYLYVSERSWKDHAAVRNFVRYYVDSAVRLAGDLGYVPLTSSQLAAVKRSVTAGTGG